MDRAEAEAIYDSGREACVEFILELAARVAQHEERLRRLEQQARQDSRTSSKPPSQDPPKTRAQRRAEARAKAKELMRREGERRKAGGQPGHRGAGRELKPEDQVDEIVDHYPDACGACGHRFDEQQRRPGGRFGRHQVCELPPISVICSEHRTHQLRCRHCRARTSARLPDLIGCSAFGPRFQAAVVTLTARHRISRRGIGELARDLFGVTICTGAVDAICQRASDALAGPHLQLQDWVLDQGAVHVDETGWRTSGEGRALWTATTPEATFLRIAERCNREQFQALIGPFPGIIVSDRWNGFEHRDPHQRQVCWSHIQRDFRRHSDGLAEQKAFGKQGLALAGRVFAAWRAYQHEHHDREQLKAGIAPIQVELQQLLEDASPKSRRTRWHRRFANNLLKIWPALWTFTTIAGVEPTNNPAERALRAPVIHRKVSLGTQSEDGERFAERALSAAATCRLQRRSLFTYLSDLIAAHARGDPFPALA
jgi:transposase